MNFAEKRDSISDKISKFRLFIFQNSAQLNSTIFSETFRKSVFKFHLVFKFLLFKVTGFLSAKN
jgi:hypothetical protein